MSEGNKSRCVKYDGRAVWNPAAVMERAARMAFRRNDTDALSACLSSSCGPLQRTASPIPYGAIQCRYEVGHDGVGIVEAGEDRYDI
jgi:hypothetical protein